MVISSSAQIATFASGHCADHSLTLVMSRVRAVAPGPAGYFARGAIGIIENPRPMRARALERKLAIEGGRSILRNLLFNVMNRTGRARDALAIECIGSYSLIRRFVNLPTIPRPVPLQVEE